MRKGCLVLLALFGVALFVELKQIRARDLPRPWVPAVLLAASVTLAAGSLQGLAEAWRRKAKPQSGPEEWRDGEPMRVSGLLRGTGEPLSAPFSGKRVLFYQYWAKEMRPDSKVLTKVASFRGMDRAPWELQTAYGPFRLEGIPRMREFLPVNHDSDAIRGRVARHVAETRWRVAPDLWTVELQEGEAMFANENGELPVHLMDRPAVELLEAEPEQHSEEHYRDRLAKRHWVYQERTVGEGEEVTVAGVFRASSGVIDLGYRAGQAENEMLPGGAAQTAAKNLTTTLVFGLVLALLAAGSHYVVYADDGALYRGLMEKVNTAR